MEYLFLKLLNISIIASWLVLAVMLIRIIFKKAPRGMLCALWALVAVRLIFPFSIESELSLFRTTEPIPEAVIDEGYKDPDADGGSDAGPILNGTGEVIDWESRPSQIIDVADPDGEPDGEPNGQPNAAPKENPSVTPIRIISALWLLGIATMAVYAAVSYLRVKSKLGEAVRVDGNVWSCDRVPSPFIIGVIRPRIILPSSMPVGDREYVIAHERAHLHRLDHLWKPFGFALLSVYWFNPVMWVAYVLLCRDIELACDERVIKDMDVCDKKAYTTALLNASVPQKMISACPLAFGEVGVKGRIRSVLNYKKPAFWLILLALVASILAAVGLLTDPPSKDAEDEYIVRVVFTQDGKRELRFLDFREGDDVSLEGLSAMTETVNEQKLSILVDIVGDRYVKGEGGEALKISDFTLELDKPVTLYETEKCEGDYYTFEIVPLDRAIREIPDYDTPYIIDRIVLVNGNTVRTQVDGIKLPRAGRVENAKDGDEIIILHSGKIYETYPARLADVYDVFLYETGTVANRLHGLAAVEKLPASFYMGALNSDKVAVSSVEHVPIYKLESVGELDAFKEKYADIIQNEYDGAVGGDTFEAVTSKFTEEYFRENAIFIVGIMGSANCTVEKIYESEGKLSVHIRDEGIRDPSEKYEDYPWLTVISVTKNDIKDVETFDAEYHRDVLTALDYKAVATNAGYTMNGTFMQNAENGEKLSEVKTNTNRAIYCFESVGELEKFKEEYKSVFAMDKQRLELPSFNSVAQYSDEEFFNKNVLLLVYSGGGSTTMRYSVNGVYTFGDKLTVYVNEKEKDTEFANEKSGSFVLVTVSREAVESVRYYGAVIGNAPGSENDTVVSELVSYESRISNAGSSYDDKILDKALNCDQAGAFNNEKPIYKFESTAELDAFRRDFDGVFGFEYSWDEMQSFDNVRGRYDGEFFSEKTLLLVYVRTGSESQRAEVKNVYRSGKLLTVYLEIRSKGEILTDLEGGHFVFVEVDKNELDGVTEYNATTRTPTGEVPEVTETRDHVEYRSRLIIRITSNVNGKNEVRFKDIDTEGTTFPFTGVGFSVESYSDDKREISLRFGNGIILADSGETIKSYTLVYGEKAEFYGIGNAYGEKTVIEIVTYGEAIDSLYIYDTPTMYACMMNNDMVSTEWGSARIRNEGGAIVDVKPGEKMIIIFDGSMAESYPLQITGLYGAFIIP